MIHQLHLRKDRTVILAGAGVSVASGIATGQMFNRTLLPFLIPQDLVNDERTIPLSTPAVPRRRPARGNIRFEQLVEIICRMVDPRLLIMQYLENTWVPSALHKWIAGAISQGIPVLTTNLDSLIELAFHDLFGKPLKQVVESNEFGNFRQGDPALLKLHGTIRRGNYLDMVAQDQHPGPFVNLNSRSLETFRVTLDTIGSLPISSQGVAAQFLLPDYVMDELKQILPGRDLLIIGYSGSDDFDISPSFRQLAPLLNRIIWIDHRSNCEPHMHSCGRFFHIRGDTRRTLEMLFGEDIPLEQQLLFDPVERFSSFCADWAKQISLTEQEKYLIAGAILHAMGFLSNALSVWEIGLENVHRGDLLAFLRFCNSLGYAYLSERSYAFSQEVFEEAFVRLPSLEERSGISERQLLIAPHSAQALLGFAFSQAVAGTIMNDREVREYGLNLLISCFDMASPGSSMSEFEVRAAIFLSQVVRNEQPRRFRHGISFLFAKLLYRHFQEIPPNRIGGPDGIALQYSRGRFDLGMLFRYYLSWPILEKNKVLRAECLKELALWYFRQGKRKLFEQCESALISLCNSLGLEFLHATYLLELADLTGHKDEGAARHLYLQAGQAFQKHGYQVAYAEACLGAAVMAIRAGDRLEAGKLLTTAIKIFENYHCHWNVEQCTALIKELILLNGEAREVFERLGDTHQDLADLVRMEENGFSKKALLNEAKGRFYRTLRRHWRENAGMAGWVTSHDLNGDSIYERLLLPW